MAISMLKIRRPLGRLIFNMGIAIPGKTVFLIETAPWIFEYPMHTVQYSANPAFLLHFQVMQFFWYHVLTTHVRFDFDLCKAIRMILWYLNLPTAMLPMMLFGQFQLSEMFHSSKWIPYVLEQPSAWDKRLCQCGLRRCTYSFERLK